MQRTHGPTAAIAVVLLTAMAAGGCASSLSAANQYQDLGRHELAVYYYGAYFRATPDDEESRRLLKGSLDHALATLKAAYDDETEAGRYGAALGAATRKAEVLSFARSAGVAELDAVTAKPELDAAWSQARAQALEAVDTAASAGAAPGELLALLRQARALDPHDAELAARYRRTRAGLTRVLTWRVQCEPALQRPCEALAAKLLQRLTAQRREITHIATQASESKNAELVLHLEMTLSDTDWKTSKRGKARGKVPRLDRFKEPVVDRKGEQVYDPVEARYELHERTAQAAVEVRVEVRDLGPSGKILLERQSSRRETDTRRYLTWKGDERALGDLTAHGTDATDPTPPGELARQAADEIADEMAKQILTELEKVTS